jgi:hypothetical protein
MIGASSRFLLFVFTLRGYLDLICAETTTALVKQTEVDDAQTRLLNRRRRSTSAPGRRRLHTSRDVNSREDTGSPESTAKLSDVTVARWNSKIINAVVRT